MILRVTPTKTEQTSAASIEVDLSECPMVVEELSKIPVENRVGPLIVNPSTGLPYRQWYFRDLWRKCARVSGIPDTVWNRDLRAGGNTEGQRAGARLDDRKKVMGHYGSVEGHRASVRPRQTGSGTTGVKGESGPQVQKHNMNQPSHTVAHRRTSDRNIS